MNSNWFALAVQPRKENYVEQQLRSADHDVACPRYVKTVRHARRQKQVEAPLFPGYLFLKLSADSPNWRNVNWIPGSIGLIKFGNSPSPLKNDFVEEFISNLGSDGVVGFNQELKRGDRVQALGGPFDGLIGEVIKMSDSERVKVLMDALNRKVEMTLPRRAVISAA